MSHRPPVRRLELFPKGKKKKKKKKKKAPPPASHLLLKPPSARCRPKEIGGCGESRPAGFSAAAVRKRTGRPQAGRLLWWGGPAVGAGLVSPAPTTRADSTWRGLAGARRRGPAAFSYWPAGAATLDEFGADRARDTVRFSCLLRHASALAGTPGPERPGTSASTRAVVDEVRAPPPGPCCLSASAPSG